MATHIDTEPAKQDAPEQGGLGPCPKPMVYHRCGCNASCAVCGHAKHSAVHMHCMGGAPGDAPWGHQYKAS